MIEILALSLAKNGVIFRYYYIHFEITGYPCNVIGSQQCDLFPNPIFFALNRIFSSPKKNGTVNQNKQSDFKVSLT